MSEKTYTLYVKTHRTTGLKYLGKCENADVEKYIGYIVSKTLAVAAQVHI